MNNTQENYDPNAPVCDNQADFNIDCDALSSFFLNRRIVINILPCLII